ncbi:MAG: hypothetical protein CTY15_08595 [Methylocystis sp.]|nr:MAG: hypothetical protein CTY15_08595 [Methylocystis sp.]
MEHKSQHMRKPVGTASRVPRERRCSQNGVITASIDGAIRLGSDPERTAQSETQRAEALFAEARSKGRIEVVEAYFDAEGLPIKRKGLGAARVARAYDAQGNQVEEAYFNTEGKPMVRKDVGAARIAWRYDASGNRVDAAFYGADGAPVRQRAPGRKGAGA